MAQPLSWHLKQAAAQIGGDEAQVEAETLLGHAAGLSPTQLVLKAQQTLSDDLVMRFNELLQRRLSGEPIAYITGEKYFHDICLQVTPSALIPRSDTELLVEQALSFMPKNTSLAVLDLGTGSGAIALSIAKARPAAQVMAVDASEAACTLAKQNAAALQLDNVQVLNGDWFAPAEGQQFDLIVSNPPYIRSGDPHLQQGDLPHEPQAALVAGEDGLAFFTTITAQAVIYLKAQGHLLFEHGYNQAAVVRNLLNQHGFSDVETVHDLSGHERVTHGQLSI